MRIKAGIILILVFGIVLTANLILANKTLSPIQLESVTTACKSCHGSIPQYDTVIQVHDKHIAFECIRCHSDVAGLSTANTVHTIFEWLAIVIAAVVLAGIIANIFITNKKGKVS